MSLLPEQIAILRGFIRNSDFMRGCVVLDLDGTVLQEVDAKVFISGSVENGVKALSRLGRPVIMNTLRFPLSIVKMIAPEWMKMAASEIPVVLLNGSISGVIKRVNEDICFQETAAYPLEHKEIESVVSGLEELLRNQMERIEVFSYPRDWKKGEIVWVPNRDRVEYIEKKYLSACEVIACPIDEFEQKLLGEDICMISTLVDHPRDVLMAYQHQNPSDHFTHRGVSKSFGIRELARRLNISLMDSIGGGDTAMDNFLNDTGLSVIVGEERRLGYRGRKETLFVKEPAELGDLLALVAEIQNEVSLQNK